MYWLLTVWRILQFAYVNHRLVGKLLYVSLHAILWTLLLSTIIELYYIKIVASSAFHQYPITHIRSTNPVADRKSGAEFPVRTPNTLSLFDEYIRADCRYRFEFPYLFNFLIHYVFPLIKGDLCASHPYHRQRHYQQQQHNFYNNNNNNQYYRYLNRATGPRRASSSRTDFYFEPNRDRVSSHSSSSSCPLPSSQSKLEYIPY